MEILKRTMVFTVLLWCFASLAEPVEGVILRAGLDAEVIYDGLPDGNGVIKVGQTRQMTIDPKTGNLYFGNILPDGESFIMIVDPKTGETSKFPYFGNGLAFNKDGSRFYFGLANLMLGVWYRDIDEYRKFTILPGVEGIQVVDDGSEFGRLLVANSDYGKNILGVDTVWEVDQNDGFYQPVLRFSDGSSEVGVNFAAVDSMAVDGNGDIYTMTGQGKILIRKANGSYVEGNSAPVTSSGLMEGGLGASPDGIVYLQDTGSGEIFANLPNGKQVMLAYGEAFEQLNNITDGGLSSDGSSLYITNARGKIIRIFANSQSSLLSNLQADSQAAVVNGVIKDGFGTPLAGVAVRLRDKSVAPMLTNSEGQFSFNVSEGLYHVLATLPNYGDFNSRVTATASLTTDLDIAMASFLPGYLPPGLVADIVATKSANAISGSSDVTFDHQGNLYSLNHSNGTITKTLLDPQTREIQSTFIAAKGGGISNAWAIAVGDDLKMYASSSNSGLLELPEAQAEEPTLLSVDPDDPRIVKDQFGVDRMVSFVTDIDGVAKMNNGDIMFTSGSGGSIIDGFPEGTVDTLIRYNPSTGTQSLFSRGFPAGSGDSVFFNADVLKSDSSDQLYVTNKGGNVVTVDTQGAANLVWRGNGEGFPEGLSSYTAFNADSLGSMFLKGVDTQGVPVLRMIDPTDDHKLLIVASQLSPSSGFGGFEFDQEGQSVVLSEWNFLLRISSTDGRTIAQNIVDPRPLRPTTNPRPSLHANEDARASYIAHIPQQVAEDFTQIDPTTVKLPALWAFERGSSSSTVAPVEVVSTQSQSSSGGGTLFWLLAGMFLLGTSRVGFTEQTAKMCHAHCKVTK
jgi:hypothetical protein